MNTRFDYKQCCLIYDKPTGDYLNTVDAVFAAMENKIQTLQNKLDDEPVERIRCFAYNMEVDNNLDWVIEVHGNDLVCIDDNGSQLLSPAWTIEMIEQNVKNGVWEEFYVDAYERETI